MAGPWQRALARAQKHASFVDLTDSRFHQNGLLPEPALFQSAFQRWLAVRSYNPDSRGALEAREALASFYGGQGWSLSADQFFVTAGTSEAYALLFSTFAEAGDEVALPRPGYPLFEHLAQHSRLRTVFYDQPFSRGWQPDAASLEACLSPRTKFVVLISPNNPTGQVLGEDGLAAVADVARRRDLMVIVDEVFDACVEQAFPRLGALASDLKVFTLNGISKRFGSPDLKLAWIAVSGETAWVKKAGEALELANDTFLSANSFSQFLLPDLFQHMGGWQRELRSLLADNRAEVERWMEREPRVMGLVPRGGIHGLWRLEGLSTEIDDEAAAVALMEAERVALHPGYFYDVQEPGVWLVYSLLKERTAFRDALARVARWVSSLEPDRSSRR